jgi:hypothetical protein
MNEKVDLGKALANNFMQAKLHVRIWSGRKTDKKASAELLADKGAVANAAAVVKNLLAGNDAKLKETSAAFTRIRSFFYENTAPWTTASVGAMKGDRLIATTKSINFLSDFAKLKNDAITVLNEFLQEYDAAVQNSAISLGALYDPAQYPSKNEIASLFGAEMALTPLPELTDFDRLTNIPVELADGLKELYERNTAAQMENALSDVQKRLLQELERMDTQLSKVAKGEKTRLFKSMVGNLKHLTGMARSMNFVNNPAIEAIADKIETHLLQHEVDAYKDNAVLARGAAQNARNIHTDVKNNEVWTVGIDGGGQVTPSTTPIGGEATFVVNEQTESDMDFLASLAEDIPTDVVEDPEDEENEPEENEKPNPIGEPEFDEDEFLFSN